MLCPNCKREAKPFDKFCRHCGTPLPVTSDISNIKEDIIDEEDIIDFDYNSNIQNEDDNTAMPVNFENYPMHTENTVMCIPDDKKEDEYIESKPLISNKEEETEEINNSLEVVNTPLDNELPSEYDLEKEHKIHKIIGICSSSLAFLLIVLFFIFRKNIYSEYYYVKAGSNASPMKQIDYCISSIKNKPTEKNKNLLKSQFLKLNSRYAYLAYSKAEEIYKYIPEKDYEEIKTYLKNKEVSSLMNLYKYEDALSKLSDLEEIGVDFKKTKNYDKIMTNISAIVTNSSVKKDKKELFSDGKVYYCNLDDDNFDEIITVSPVDNGYSYFSKISVYKFKNGAYSLYASKQINDSQDYTIKGVYKKCIYIQCTDPNTGNNYINSYNVKDKNLIYLNSMSEEDFKKTTSGK